MFRNILIGLFLMCLSGCSEFRILYLNADSLIEWKVEAYLDQTAKDKRILSDNIEKVLEWHRGKMLIKYTRFLDKQLLMLKEVEVKERHVSEAIKDLRGLIEITIRGASPFIAGVLVHHTSKKKLSFLEDRFEEETMEEEGKLRKSGHKGKDRLEKVVANFNRVLGSLNQAQITMIDYYVIVTGKQTTHWHKRNKGRREALVKFLRKEQKKERIESFVVDLLLSKGREGKSEEWWKHFTNLMIGILTSLEKKQIVQLIETLEVYRDEMKVLVQK